ncbi:hypothetical protein B0H13DRAFT_1607450 [Mycena leptocephala]|nr:hypothetical protein B0H13DRAFT_1607450 [Mycena leptocephala]
MNFQSLPFPLSRFQGSGDPLRPVRRCGCNCIAACRCACSCGDHCTCKVACEGDCAANVSRNLVVSLDGVFNKFGSQGTNVVELHSLISIDPSQKQLTYYDCATGAYNSSKHWLRRVENTLDRAMGWNFKKTILNAYLWLCEHYKPGDKIFLFGFSRGAHQVRTLAAMIDKVGLANAGNPGLITLAYDVFFEALGGQTDAIREAERFKITFARNTKIHFVGAWDTVASAGIGRKVFSLHSSAEHVCIFRHALALDECRVKFLPAYTSRPPLAQIIPEGKTSIPNIKEVWFVAKHEDM